MAKYKLLNEHFEELTIYNTLEELKQSYPKVRRLAFEKENDLFVYMIIPTIPFEKEIKELQSIQQWLNDNDWIPNKIITGEWTTDDPRWIEYLQERIVKRTRQDEINTILGGTSND